ncbi:WXG100 family type VII secretion target [Plantibacter sp. RU18]
MGCDGIAICGAGTGADEAVAILETRVGCVQDVLGQLSVGITALGRGRAEVEWDGLAALQFSAAADELIGELRNAASALDEALRKASWAAASISTWGIG